MNKKIVILIIAAIALCVVILAFTKWKSGEQVDEFEIIDETTICAEALEGFYSDSVYDYYFPCIKSKNVFVKFKDGRKILATDALKEGLITIGQLEDSGLTIYKELRIL